MDKLGDAIKKQAKGSMPKRSVSLSDKKTAPSGQGGNGKPKSSAKSYSLPQIAQLLGVEEKQIFRYAHKGLINPRYSVDDTLKFTEVDLARLIIIKQADQLGYSTDTILGLIGDPAIVLNVENPAAACEQFAVKKYKQLYDELNHCEPLEQINKQCDLTLVKSYIKDLRRLQKTMSPTKAAPQEKNISPPAKGRQPISAPSAATTRFTDSGRFPRESTQPKKSVRKGGRKHAGPSWALWFVVGIMVAGALSAYYFLRDDTNRVDETPITAESQVPRSTADSEAPGQKPAEESAMSVTALAAEEKRETELPVLSDLLSDEVPTRTEMESNQDTLENTPDNAASILLADGDAQEASALAELSAPVEPPSAPVQSLDVAQPVEKRPPQTLQSVLVNVKNVSLWHDALNNTYRADFQILNTSTENNQGPVTGYSFVYLGTNNHATDQQGLLLPQSDIQSGRPTQISRGARFSIRHAIQMRVSAVSTTAPNEITDKKVMIFSSDGGLLLEKSVEVPIRPYFSEPKKVAALQEDIEKSPIMTNQEAPSTTPEKSPSVPLGQPKTDVQRAAPEPKMDKPVAPSAVVPAANAAATSQPPANPETPLKAESRSSGSEAGKAIPKKNPITIPQRTNDPEAIQWEQRSYDAAVQGDFDEAIAHAYKAIELDPGKATPYINRSWAYIEQDKLDLAIQDSDMALLIDPQNAYAYNNRGLAYERKAEMQKAKDNYFKACELGLNLGCQNHDSLISQSLITELIDQSQIAFRNKNWDDVIRAATEVLNLDPRNAVAYSNRSAAFAQKNLLNKALNDSNEAIKYNPDFPLGYNNRGYVYELLGSDKKAAADYLKSCSLGSDLGCNNFERLSNN